MHISVIRIVYVSISPGILRRSPSSYSYLSRHQWYSLSSKFLLIQTCVHLKASTISNRLFLIKMPYFEPNVAVTEKAAFGIQCFWHSEAYLASTPGVLRTRVGYAGGKLINPTYRNLDDHIETIDVEFDPQMVTYESLLNRFWKAHDPTIKHKRQYISAIFYYDEKQKKIAESSLEKEQRQHTKKIVTQVLPIGQFYNAENYHQKYLLRCEKALFTSLQLTDEEVIKSHVAAKLNGYVAGYGTFDEFIQESRNWGLNDPQIDIAKNIVMKKDGKAEGCGI